jgi:hypothetical protein
MMCRSAKTIIVAVLMFCAAESATRADIRLKIKNTEDGRSGESVIRIKGRRQRNDFSGTRPDGTTAALAVIFQCDLKRQISFDPTKPVFYEHPHIGIQEFMARAEAQSAGGQRERTRRVKYDGRLVETFTVTDTGERREMFGYTARRIKTTLTWEATPESCPQTSLRRESDGWYVDLLYATFCSYDISGFDETELTVHEQSKCVDHYMGDGKQQYSFERRQVGTARFGFPLLLTVKSYNDEGRPRTRTSEVVEINREELDASLFEPPAGYTKFTPKKRSLASRALSLFGKG